MNIKKISLNLEHYFKDYRKFSRIGVNNDAETIGDLKERIADVFELERNFYLMSHNFFLPSTESIHLLNDNELITVVPSSTSEINISNATEIDKEIKISKKENHKHSNETEIIENVKKLKKKCKKDKPERDLQCMDEDNDNKVANDFLKPKEYKKKNKKPKKEEIDTTEKEKTWDTRSTEKNEIDVRSVEDNMEIDNSKSNGKKENSSKKNNSNSAKTPETNGTNIVVNETVVQNELSDSVQLESCNNLEEKIRKRRRCITPLKYNCRMTASDMITIENKLLKDQAPETTQKLIVQSVEIVEKENQLNTDSIIMNTSNRQSYSLNDVIKFDSNNSSPNVHFYKRNKVISGVGNFLKQLQSETDDSISRDEFSDTTKNEIGFITTRKRVRHRKRKNKNKQENNSSIESPAKIFKPPNTIAAPKLHIKFNNEGEKNSTDVAEIPNSRNSETFLIHSTPIKQTNNNETTDNPNKGNSISLLNNKVKSTNINDVAVNNVLIFKRLKIGQNYNPVLSEKITGKVLQLDGENINLQIIDGKEEFKDPIGKFSCIIEEDETESDSVIIDRSSILELTILDA